MLVAYCQHVRFAGTSVATDSSFFAPVVAFADGAALKVRQGDNETSQTLVWWLWARYSCKASELERSVRLYLIAKQPRSSYQLILGRQEAARIGLMRPTVV